MDIQSSDPSDRREPSLTIVRPTLRRILLIWFSITVRALTIGVGFALGAALIIGAAVAAGGGGEAQIRQIAAIVGPLLGLAASLYAAYAQLGKKCGDVRLVLVKAE
jgi:hypothetical protein